MKQISIKLKDEKKLEFELLEDAKKGDFVNLNSINNVDLSDLKNKINQFKDEEYKSKIEQELIQKENELKLKNEKEILILRKEYQDSISKLKDEKLKFENQNEKEKLDVEKIKVTQILDLENKIKSNKFEFENKLRIELAKAKEEQINKILELENDLKLQRSKFESEQILRENKLSKEKLEFEKLKTNEILELKSNLKTKDEEFSNKLKSESIRLEKEQINKILELENNIKLQKEKHENELNLRKKEFDLEKEKEILDYENKIKSLEEKNALMLRNRQNIKVMGEEFEGWIENELKKAFGYNEEIKIIRQPAPISGQKPDFLIEIKHKYNTSKIVIEAKTQMNSDGVKKKNIDHLEKLEKYRVKSNSDYAILVSELEANRDFQIYKDNDYPYIFILRPIHLISFLQFTISLLKANQKIHNENINFENKLKIIEGWEEYKKSMFDSFEKVGKKVKDIYDEKEKIIISANKIEQSIKTIYDFHFNALKNKLESFNIEKKIIKKIENINEISEIEDLPFEKVNELF